MPRGLLDAPKLSDWLTGAEIAELLGISRQSVNRMMNRGEFKTLHRIGTRPIYIAKKSEVDSILKTRQS